MAPALPHPREVFPGIFQIKLPLPFELASVNVHLVRLQSGFMLIDCGMDLEACFSTLQGALIQAAIPWPEIRQILLTHIHPDHMGLSKQLLSLTGARLIMHETERRLLTVINTPERRAQWIGRAFSESGVPEPLQARMQEHFGVIRRNFHPVVPDQVLEGGERIETAIGPFEVILTPGHSPGHVCLYSERHRLLISGDTVLPDITPNISWQPDLDTLADFIGSLEGLRGREVDLILPSHGEPFRGHRQWIADTIRHHHERCEEIGSLLEGEPRTAHSLVADLWTRKLSPINHQFALLEVMAHLEYMERRRQVRSGKDAGIVRWRRG